MHLYPPPPQQDRRRAAGNDSPPTGADITATPAGQHQPHLPAELAAALEPPAPPRRLGHPRPPLAAGCPAPHLCQLPPEPLPQLPRTPAGNGTPQLRPPPHPLPEPAAGAAGNGVLAVNPTRPKGVFTRGECPVFTMSHAHFSHGASALFFITSHRRVL